MKISNHVAFMRLYNLATENGELEELEAAENWANSQEKFQQPTRAASIFVSESLTEAQREFLFRCWYYGTDKKSGMR